MGLFQYKGRRLPCPSASADLRTLSASGVRGGVRRQCFFRYDIRNEKIGVVRNRDRLFVALVSSSKFYRGRNCLIERPKTDTEKDLQQLLNGYSYGTGTLSHVFLISTVRVRGFILRVRFVTKEHERMDDGFIGAFFEFTVGLKIKAPTVLKQTSM